MKLILVMASLALLLSLPLSAQITPLGDTYANSADPTTNYGSKTLLDVDGASQIAYIQFNLASIPSGASISQATLKLYVDAVTTAGSFNVDYVNGTWSESALTYNNAPALSGAIVSGVPITTADKNQYILINVTSAVQAWMSGNQTNDGIALVANSTFKATFDSKENTTTSHPAELDIAYAGGDGTITGVTTASGSGLTGGGTSGTLNLSLLNTCAANQVLQWNGSVWACSNAGTGTITGVTAGTDLTGGGTSGSVTLNLNTTATNALYAQLATANTFTGNQTVNGNLSATVVNAVSTFNLEGLLFAWGNAQNFDTYLGFYSGNPNSNDTGKVNTAIGYQALIDNTSGSVNTAVGSALLNNTIGSNNTGVGAGALFYNSTGDSNSALGWDAGPDSSTPALNNSTAIGAFADVAASNSMVLGSINGVNGATVSVSVGIGTTAPAATLDVRDNGSGGNTISAITAATEASAVFANNTATSGSANGGFFSTHSPSGSAVVGINYGSGGNDYAAYFQGNVTVTGTLTKGSGSFKIDDPLDPANKYLSHSFVESPDMMNVYNGNITTSQRGLAVVVLPDYFEALNRDFRYQLTVIGQFAQAIVAHKIAHNRFVIRTNKPGVEVSWQVTGIRHDAYADAHRIPTEEMKTAEEQGHYLHPELFGASQEQAVGYRLSSPIAAAVTPQPK